MLGWNTPAVDTSTRPWSTTIPAGCPGSGTLANTRVSPIALACAPAAEGQAAPAASTATTDIRARPRLPGLVTASPLLAHNGEDVTTGQIRWSQWFRPPS